MSISVTIDGRALMDGFTEDGRAFVALKPFCKAIEAEAKEVEGVGLAVCRGDLCIPLAGDDVRERDGELFASITAFGEPLGLTWKLEDGRLAVTTRDRSTDGAPGPSEGSISAFELPDLFSGEPVNSREFLGKKTVFFAWASW